MMLRFHEFTQPLAEAAEDKASGGVTHLTHIEDAILLQGGAGIQTAVDYLQKVLDLATDGENSLCVTTKFDGAPALVVGVNPENGKFFVGTKSVFNKTPKINYTDADIDTNHPQGGLNTKLKIALKHLKGLGIRGILQGDMLFTKPDLKPATVNGKRYITFRPNTLTYAVPADSGLAKEISGAEMGIVFHTKYEGNRMNDLSPSFAPDISYLKRSRRAWVIDANLQSGDVGTCGVPINSLQRKEIEMSLQNILKTGRKSVAFLNSLQKIPGLVDDLMIYINSNVRQGVAQGSSQGFLAYMNSKIERELGGLKDRAARETRIAATKRLTDSIESNSTKFDSLFSLHSLISETKLLVIARLRQTKMRLDAFTQEQDRLVASPPEGFVVVNRMNNRAYKLVDRLDFSRKNFNLPKNW